MANRTLRRPYNGTERESQPDAGTNGSDTGSESELESGIETTDSIVDGTGNDNEHEPVSNGSIGYVTVDPSNLGEFIASGGSTGNNDGSGRTRKPRSDAGKPRGTRAGKKKAQETVEPFLMMAHQWAAVLLHTPELELEQNEAKQLSDAYAVFCQHHDIPVLSEKRMSEINLIGAALIIYGPRMVAVRNRIKQESRAKRAKNVTPFQQPMQQPIQ